MPMEGIQIRVEYLGRKEDIAVVRISGYIDTTTASELERVVQNLLREQRFKMIIDLQNVEYISSAGWGIFISEIKHIRSRTGDLKLANMSPGVTEVYELLEFSTILNAARSVEEAMEMFGEYTPERAAATEQARTFKSEYSSKPLPITPQPMRPVSPPAAASSSAPGAKPAPAKPIAPAPSEPFLPASKSALSGKSDESLAAPAGPLPALVPLIERVKSVVRAHPDWGAWKIKKELNRTRGQFPKVGWGEVRSELKYSSLESKPSRFKFAGRE